LSRSRPAPRRGHRRRAVRAPRARVRANLCRDGHVQVGGRGRPDLVKTIVVAGAASGVGKTTVTLGLMAALRRRGLTVQGFKIGPDFIDPAFHALVTGRPSYTLDAWMCGRDAVRATVARHADADVA